MPRILLTNPPEILKNLYGEKQAVAAELWWFL